LSQISQQMQSGGQKIDEPAGLAPVSRLQIEPSCASYNSIDEEPSITSGLPTYSAPPGVRSYGAGSTVKYQWPDSLSDVCEEQRLGNAAAESPLTDDRGSPNQRAGVGRSPSFVVGN